MQEIGVRPHERLEGVYLVRLEDGSERLATKNLSPGVSVYGERLIRVGSAEYRLWDPFRSKLAAAILNGLRAMPIRPGSRVLYLGSAAGTTASHVSDIIGEGGSLYCVEFAPRVMKEFMAKVCAHRSNVFPILADARFPENYPALPGMTFDSIYCDVAQADQARILSDNADLYLRRHGGALIAIKSRSVDVARPPSSVYRQEIEVLEERGFRILERVRLEPYEKDHMMISATFNPP
ncbi:MAG: fibrillarin-like rRNA/tRNA 2'-O-methyltransferase [Candidatus Bathyarchaeia archaeon]